MTKSVNINQMLVTKYPGKFRNSRAKITQDRSSPRVAMKPLKTQRANAWPIPRVRRIPRFRRPQTSTDKINNCMKAIESPEKKKERNRGKSKFQIPKSSRN